VTAIPSGGIPFASSCCSPLFTNSTSAGASATGPGGTGNSTPLTPTALSSIISPGTEMPLSSMLMNSSSGLPVQASSLSWNANTTGARPAPASSMTPSSNSSNTRSNCTSHLRPTVWSSAWPLPTTFSTAPFPPNATSPWPMLTTNATATHSGPPALTKSVDIAKLYDKVVQEDGEDKIDALLDWVSHA
jgi:hypothetical protein